MPRRCATSERLTDSDQWTLQSIIRNNMPMHRIALGDAAGTEYYVSEKTGEPVLRTTAQRPVLGLPERRAALAVLHAAAAARAFWNSFVVWVVAHRHRHVRDGHRHRHLALLAVGPLPPARRAVAHAVCGLDEVASLRRALSSGSSPAPGRSAARCRSSPFDFLKASPPTRAFREAATGGPDRPRRR